MNSGLNNKSNNNLGLNSYDPPDSSYNTYGLSASFLSSLRIQGPLHNKVFVANVSTLSFLVTLRKHTQTEQSNSQQLLSAARHLLYDFYTWNSQILSFCFVIFFFFSSLFVFALFSFVCIGFRQLARLP